MAAPGGDDMADNMRLPSSMLYGVAPACGVPPDHEVLPPRAFC